MKERKSALNLREIVVMASISIVFGIVYLIAIFFNQIVGAILGPIGSGLIAGVWIMAPIVCMYIIRKPGVALIAQMIAALTEVLIGSYSAGLILILGLTQGLAAEAIFALLRWKKFHLSVLMISGMAGTMANLMTQYVMLGFSQYSVAVVVFMAVTMLISGALVAGLLSKKLADALCLTGVLNNFALGKIRREQRMREDVQHYN